MDDFEKVIANNRLGGLGHEPSGPHKEVNRWARRKLKQKDAALAEQNQGAPDGSEK